MKILQVIPSLSNGGAEGFVTNLGVNLHQLGADVQFYVLGGARGDRGQALLDRLTAVDITVHGVPERYPASPGNWVKLARIMHAWKPDIVQANLYPAEVIAAAAKLATFRKRPRFFRRLANTDFVGYRSPTVVRAMDRFYPHAIACSPAVNDAYRAFMNNQQRCALTTIPNGGLLLDTPPSKEERMAARTALGIDPNAFVVTHIGRMCSGGNVKNGGLDTGQKAHDVLIRSFAQAVREIPNGHLLLVGDGPLRPAAEGLVGELGITDRVTFLGQQSEPWPALNAAEMFCFPSRYEGLPNVLPEAASAGLPVVASDIPEINSLAPDEGWVLPPVDDVDGFAAAIQNVYAHRDRFQEQAQAAAGTFRKRFSMTACAEKYLQTFTAALNAYNRKHG